MALREVLTLNEATPQVEAPQAGDTYYLVRDVTLKTGVITSEVADGASAVAFGFNSPAYTTSGSKLASWSNNGTEKAHITKDGTLSVRGAAGVGPTTLSDFQLNFRQAGGGGASILVAGSAMIGLPTNNGVASDITFYTSLAFFPTGTTYTIGPKDSNAPTSLTVSAANANADNPASLLKFQGGNAAAAATTNVNGGGVLVQAGASATGSGNGGTVTVRGGTSAAGSVGNIIMDTLPTSDPGVAGALWNNSNVLNVSAG